MSIFKLPSFLRGKNPKPLIEVFAEPEEEQSHSSGVERSDSAKEVGKPILAEEPTDANSQGEEVPIHDGRPQSRRRRKKKTQSQDGQG
jgi:hypothetical protein